MELPFKIKRAVRRYETITAEGLNLYPVRVSEYDDWCIARPAIEAMQQAFPVKYLSMPLLSAMYRMDYEAMISGQQPSGLFQRALLAIALAVRLGEGETPDERIKRFRILADEKDLGKLKGIRFWSGGDEMITITPIQFQRLRPIIAAQNGVELVSDDANPELVQAERDIQDASGEKLDADIYTLIASVAALSNIEEAEIDDWPILKLMTRSDSFKRVMDYVLCGMMTAQGAKWPRGNPAPHPYFPPVQKGSAALVSVQDFGRGVMPLKSK